ncbi:MAG: methylmalonyl-CoA mutase [Planctomycetota bacterium]
MPPAGASPPTGDHDERARWERDVRRPFLAAHPERRDAFETPSGILLEPAYPTQPPQPWPGEFPFTRGIYPSMYRGRIWTMRQYAGYSSPRQTNERFRFLLEKGQTGLSVAFDLPTQIGYDSDAPEALGEVGRVGVPISTLDDLDELLREIPLERASISMTINSTACILFAMLLALARRRGVPWTELRGTLQNDILKEYIARGTQRFPVEPSLRLAVDLIEFAGLEAPRFHPISVSGYHIREAGATAVEEVAFTLANGITYLERCRERGLDLERVGRRLSFFFNAHNHLFEEVAKFRAARRLWAGICRDRFDISSDRACELRFHCQTAGSTLTAQEPRNNIVRVTVQALAAALGGAQSLHTNASDEALSLPSEGAAKLALRTQQVLARESGITEVADPLGGCPYVESLTGEIEERARRLILEIDRRGGTVAAIDSGFLRRLIEASAYRAQAAIDSGEARPVGVEAEGAIPDAPFRVDQDVEEERRRGLEAFRARRDAAGAASAREGVREGARRAGNILPALIEAVEAGTTLGEIAATLAEELGEHRDG